MSEVIRHPDLRLRVKHVQTTKGWRLDETSIEVSCDLGGEGNQSHLHHMMRLELEVAYQLGTAEARRRNVEEGRDL
jgi:hypothetical protein